MPKTLRSYHAFLVRIWQVEEQSALPGSWEWRASLEDPHSHIVYSFPSLQALSNYLAALAEAPEQPDNTALLNASH